jgi:hypothetical protein
LESFTLDTDHAAALPNDISPVAGVALSLAQTPPVVAAMLPGANDETEGVE